MEKLTGPNHDAWAASLKADLERRGMWGAVGQSRDAADESTAATRRRQRVSASRSIVESLDTHVLRDLLMSAPPENLWRVLEERYRDQAFGSVMEKAFAYFDCRFDAKRESLAAHIARMDTHVETLASMEFVIPESLQIILLLQSFRGCGQFAPLFKAARRWPQSPSRAFVVEQLLDHQKKSPTSVNSAVGTSSRSTLVSQASPQSAPCSSTMSSWSLVANTAPSASTSTEFTEETMAALARAMQRASMEMGE